MPTQIAVRLIQCVLTLLLFVPAMSLSAPIQEVAELLTHPENFDHHVVTVVGQVTNLQLATNRQGQIAYGFLLKDQAGTIKVIALGKAEVQEGDHVLVEGIFSKLRQVGKVIVFNEIKANSIRPLDKLNPDLVG
jgi:hypothetical protein